MSKENVVGKMKVFEASVMSHKWGAFWTIGL